MTDNTILTASHIRYLLALKRIGGENGIRSIDIAKDLMLDMPANSNGFRYLLGASKSYKETFFGDRKLLS